jgi:hypothetical protein
MEFIKLMFEMLPNYKAVIYHKKMPCMVGFIACSPAHKIQTFDKSSMKEAELRNIVISKKHTYGICLLCFYHSLLAASPRDS